MPRVEPIATPRKVNPAVASARLQQAKARSAEITRRGDQARAESTRKALEAELRRPPARGAGLDVLA